jgi:hypothetical protein
MSQLWASSRVILDRMTELLTNEILVSAKTILDTEYTSFESIGETTSRRSGKGVKILKRLSLRLSEQLSPRTSAPTGEEVLLNNNIALTNFLEYLQRLIYERYDEHHLDYPEDMKSRFRLFFKKVESYISRIRKVLSWTDLRQTKFSFSITSKCYPVLLLSIELVACLQALLHFWES